MSVQDDPSIAYGVIGFEKADDSLFSMLHEVRRDPHRRVLLVSVSTQPADPSLTWRLLHAGASDLVKWSDPSAGAQVIAKLQRWTEVDDFAAQAVSQEALIGESSAWRVLIRKVVEAGRFSTMPVLLIGESGTGKELLAKLISAAGAGAPGTSRFRKELVTVDCGSLVPELSGSEFFGHERGAFTGAHMQREGAFAMADGATLLLDEIGEIPLGLQAQLLRAIQEKTYKRVGGNVWQKTNFRLVCATNRNLEDLVQRGQFRLDLYYRIAGCVFRTLPLAERKEDILLLARHFLASYLPGSISGFDNAVSEYLLNRVYNGNIRELRQLIERIAYRHAGQGPITAGDIPDEDRPPNGDIDRAWPDEELERSISNALATGTSLTEINRVTADTAIRMAVRSEQGNLQRAASKLGITDRALQMRRAADRQREQQH
ncbi:MAG TPA: sigma 54-interacting transcriptional regulator [Bryobacteraceae bacterium]|nr:sigma 54-interacting transcriptional regulator [Bryobacteraceae bacterium]